MSLLSRTRQSKATPPAVAESPPAVATGECGRILRERAEAAAQLSAATARETTGRERLASLQTPHLDNLDSEIARQQTIATLTAVLRVERQRVADYTALLATFDRQLADTDQERARLTRQREKYSDTVEALTDAAPEMQAAAATLDDLSVALRRTCRPAAQACYDAKRLLDGHIATLDNHLTIVTEIDRQLAMLGERP